MRVTFIAGTYQPQRCGVAHYTQRLRQQLHQRGVHTTVLTTQAAASACGSPSVQGAVETWSPPQLIPLIRAILATPSDILHIQHAAGSYRFERSLFLLPPLLRLAGYRPPLVVTLHEYGWWEWQPDWFPARALEWLKRVGQHRGWWDREDGFLITGTDAAIVTHAEAAMALQDRLPYHQPRFIPIAANVEVTPEAAAADRELLRAELRWRYGWPQTAEVAVFFGFLHPTKGLETLLRAFEQVQRRCPNARLLVMGGVRSLALADEAEWYWDKLHRIATELGLASRSAFTGYLPGEAVSRHLLGCDLGVLPFNHGVTLKSGSLLTLMAHGLPTVATQSDPPDPTLSEALLRQVPPKQPARLGTAIADLITTPAQRDAVARAGLDFTHRLSWDAIAQRHVDLYRSLI